MKKFTVKDFITYNGPCFSCGSRVNVKIGVIKVDVADFNIALLNPVITTNSIDIDLKINYNSSLKLSIFSKTNKFSTSSMKGLTEYLNGHKLFLRSNCDHCYTKVESQYLEFNLLKGFIKPVGVSNELLVVNDGANLYQVHTSYIEEKSLVIIDRINKTTPITPVRMDLPLLPLYKFKDKDHFIAKIKTYLVFS
jgi:hypothetical protein